MTILTRIEETIFKLVKGLVSLAVVTLLLFVTAQIISRYFNIAVLKPPDEIITLTFAWFVFLGSALLVRDRDHLKIELFDGFLENKPRLKTAYQILISALMLIFIVVLLRSGLTIYERAGTRSSPMLQLPQRIWYSSLVVSGYLMLFYSLLNILQGFYRLIRGKQGES